MVIRVLGKYLRLDLRTGPDCPEGHVGPCPPQNKLEASGGGQFEFGFTPNESDPTAARRGTVGQRPTGAGEASRGSSGCGVPRQSVGRFHVQAQP